MLAGKTITRTLPVSIFLVALTLTLRLKRDVLFTLNSDLRVMREMLFGMEWTVSRDAVIENECLFLVQRISITDQRLSKVQLPAYPISAAFVAGSSLSGMECTKQKPDMKDIGLSAIGLKRPGMIGTTMASKCK